MCFSPLNAFQTLPFFFCRFALFFRSTLAGGTGSVVGEILFRQEQE